MANVCLVVQNVYDFDARVRRKAEALVSAGYSVDVLALTPASGKKSYVLNGVNIHTIALGKQRGSLFRYFFEYGTFFVWTFFTLILLMRKRHYAVVDVNTLPDFLIFSAVPARWMGAKLVLDMHEITPEFYISKYGISEHSWLIHLLRYQEKISFDCADRVITINKPIEDLLVRRGLDRSKSIVLMNAVDEERFSANLASAPAKTSSEAFVMMYHGTLTKIYGLDIAIEAFSLVHNEMPHAELWILGSGTEEKALSDITRKRALDSKVKLVGQVRSEEIPSWLNKCDVGILPIRRDVFLDFAFPNKLPEFIIMGKAVLMSRLAAIRHYFSDEALAFCEPCDAADLSKQMVRLYRDRSLCGRLAEKAKKEYEPIRWGVMKARYLELVGNLSEQKAGSFSRACMPADGANQ